MDHNGLYTDLDSFASITSCGATSNSFNDTCSTLPSINNFKYQQSNQTGNIYQQPVQVNHEPQQKTSQALPQTQININNCNNNIFFPHDDVLYEAATAPTCASSTNNQSQKNNFIGHVQKELETTGVGGGRDNSNPLKNVYFNINNINTNIVNNIQNPTNFASSADIFSGNQYHQINKNGETIINFTNNNLNSAGSSSMPADSVSATSQNYYGYQTNNSQGQQTIYESSVQSQTQSQSQSQGSAFLDPSVSATKSSMSGSSGHYHSQHLNHTAFNQTMTNGTYPGTNSIPSEHSSTTVDPFSEFPETLSTAKIINNFESKNPLKYSTSNRPSGAYYKTPTEFPSHQYGHLPPHNYPGMYPTTKMPSSHNYEPYPRMPRNNAPHYPTQHYAAPTIDEHNASRLNYNRAAAVSVHNPYHHPHPLPHPTNNYGSYYTNGYGSMPYPAYPQPGPPYGNLIRNDSCSKPSTNYKTSAVSMSPVEHGNYALPHGTNYSTPKKDFYNENPYYPPPHSYYEDPMNNSCAKKSSSRPKVTNDIYNPNGVSTLFPDHHSMPHHQQGVRNLGFQPMPKLYSTGSQPTYSMPTNSCDLASPYHNFNYQQHPKMPKLNPAMSAKQFKSYGHFEPFPHPHGHYTHPQYHTMQAKHPEKIKISIDLEEQINSSKIPKIPGYGYDPHHQLYYQYHHMPPRHPINENDPKNSIANINLSLRDFLSTWNEIDEEDESGERRTATNGALDDLNEHVERTIMREYNPMFVQNATDSFMSASNVPSNSAADKSQLSELESGIINEGTEKLYVLESIDVPLSELNKYKHLSVINKLPENVVINDNDDSSMKFIEEIDLTREKLYKSEFELEFEACQERKSIDEPVAVKPQEVLVERPMEEIANKSDSEEKTKEKKKSVKVKAPKLKCVDSKIPKIKQSLSKLKKEKILKAASKDPRKARITKRAKKYSLNPRTSSVRSLKSTCVDFLNTSAYRNYAREQLSIINKHSKMRILQDFKKKFNFDGMKRANAAVNQKVNRSMKMNSLRDLCGELLKEKSRMLEINESEDVPSENCEEFPSLKELSRRVLSDMDINVVENEYLYSPLTLKELCESFIYSHNQYFLIEEVSSVPKLQDLCKNVLSETNIFINIDEENNGIFSLNDESEAIQSSEIVGEDIYIEENSDNVGELFESEQLNSFERSEILRKIQRVANIEDDDEIIRAIGALHRDDDVESIINNNNSNVTNKNFSDANEFHATNDETKFDSEMSFMSLMDDDLLHSVQYEEIISVNDRCGKATKKIIEILRFKRLNRSDIKQATKTIRAILRKSLAYQRTHRFRNAKRREQIEALKLQARAALWKLKELRNCDNISNNSTSERSFIEASPINQREFENESQYDAKDDTKAQSPNETIFDHEPTPFLDDSPDDCFDAHAELNFPKLPAMFPSINEYKLDRKSSSRGDVKDTDEAKRRRLTFDESLLSIEKQEVRRSRQSSPRSHHRRHHRHHSSRSHESSRRHHKHSSRHNNYKPRDQMKHSEAKRLVIPSYKLYDKDLDVKLKIMPFVRIEREERVDDMVKQYN